MFRAVRYLIVLWIKYNWGIIAKDLNGFADRINNVQSIQNILRPYYLNCNFTTNYELCLHGGPWWISLFNTLSQSRSTSQFKQIARSRFDTIRTTRNIKICILRDYQFITITVNKHETFGLLEVSHNFLCNSPLIRSRIKLELSENTNCVGSIRASSHLHVHKLPKAKA